jgi:hypothetical protein
MRYLVTFPGPVGKTHAGIAATVVYVEAERDEVARDIRIAEEVLAYLKGIGVLDSQGKTVEPSVAMLADGSAGTGALWRKGKRIGTFQLERLGEPNAGTTK